MEQLKKIKLFSRLPEETLKWLNSKVTWEEFDKGSYLFREGEIAEKTYLVVKGSVKIVKEFSSGKNAIMGIFGPGSLVAEVAAVDNRPYPASCVALESSSAGAVPAKVFQELLKKEPNVAIMMIAGLGYKLRELTENLGAISVMPVDKRLARLLHKLAPSMGVKSASNVEITLHMTRRDMAEIIGTSFEVVERSLKKFREDNLISVDGKKITIHDYQKLEEMFED
ncbi:MAG: Crp/Fnr family transcriptional regulator [Nitrospinae bacterium]|nr:Crp/Fnr family transcriptional regulator [Nitrospinota bacterium]MBF0633294.1 Crp/Fnr family transcriptional regulator [Nitrospinota bacterium]